LNRIKVVNKNNHIPTNNDFYIGRGSVLGNPYTSKKLDNTKATFQCSSREEAIDKYNTYLRGKIRRKDKEVMSVLNEMIEALKTSDINLLCYCKPKDCHGDIIQSCILKMISQSIMDKILNVK